MTRENGQEGNKQVVDEDGDVDTKVKDTIIEARNRVDKTRYKLDVEAPLDPELELSRPRRTHIFAKTVKQYLIRIEPLLRSDEIQGNEAYYLGGAEPLATFKLVPTETEGYQFGLVTKDYSEDRIRQMIGLPRGVELPTPKQVVFQGLKDVIEQPMMMTHEWEVCVEKQGAPPNWDYVYPRAEQLVPEQVYLDAVRESDQFLQEVGVGVETGLPEVDERSEPF